MNMVKIILLFFFAMSFPGLAFAAGVDLTSDGASVTISNIGANEDGYFSFTAVADSDTEAKFYFVFSDPVTFIKRNVAIVTRPCFFFDKVVKFGAGESQSPNIGIRW